MESPEQSDSISPISTSTELLANQEAIVTMPLHLQGQERTFRSWRGRSLRAVRVTGIEEISEGHTQVSNTFELPRPEIDNLRQFFDEHILHPKDDERYNCHYFGYSVAGWTGAQPPRTRREGLARAVMTGRLNMAYSSSQLRPVQDPSTLEPGKIYGIGSSGKIFHTLVGLNGPSLSVLGIGKNPDLVIADGGELAKFYGGELYEIASPSLVASSVYSPRIVE
jgi:hypothetical protein